MKTLSFTFWLLVTVASFLGALLALIGMSSMSYSSGPSTAPLQGFAFAAGLGICAVCTVIFAVCLKARPAYEAFTPFNLSVALFSSIAVLGGIWFSVHNVNHYALSVHVVNSDNQAIQGASIRFQSSPLGEGIGKLDHLAEGTATTSASGNATIMTNHAHEIRLDISASGFKNVDLLLYAAGHSYPHQIFCGNIEVSANGKPVPNMGTIPANGNIFLTVTLPKQ